MPSNAILSKFVDWINNRGRNPIDDPSTLPDDQSQESRNIMLESVGIGTRRRGIGAGLVGLNYSPYVFDQIRSLGAGRITLELTDPTHLIIAAAFDASSPTKLVFGGQGGAESCFASTALVDAVTSNPKYSIWVPHNGKIYVAFQSAVNRLHCVRKFAVTRTGLPTPAAPTGANTGSGTYAATIRYYRIQWRTIHSLFMPPPHFSTLYSNLGTALSITPSGSGTGINVTRPAFPANELVTHWVVYGSADGSNFYKLSGNLDDVTTVFFDNVTPSTYFSGRELAPLEGAFTPWPSVRYLLSTGDRLLGFGLWDVNSTSYGLPVIRGRVYLSPVANTTDTDDDERISNTLTIKGWVDIGPKNAGLVDRGLVGPLDDLVFAFQDKGVWALIPTGNDVAPYRRVRLDPEKGSCGQRSHFIGEDEAGRPCAYFVDPIRGPYRYGSRGFEWLGYDVQDYAGNSLLVNSADDIHGVWDPKYRCCRWWVDVDDDGDPQTQIVFFPRHARANSRGDVRGGWAVHDGLSGRAVCSAIGLPPYGFNSNDTSDLVMLGMAPGVADTVIAVVDNSLNTFDNPSKNPVAGTDFEGYATSRAFNAARPQLISQMGLCYAQAKAITHGRVRQQVILDFDPGAPQGVESIDLTPATATQLRVLKRFQSLQGLTNFYSFAVTIGDLPITSTLVTLDTPGTFPWVVPESGVALIECVGAGGGTPAAASAFSRGGAGGGSYARGRLVVTAGETLTAIVGAGAIGVNGGVSSVANTGGVVVAAPGGATAGTGGTGGTGEYTQDGAAGGAGGCAAPNKGAGGGGAGGRSPSSPPTAGTDCNSGVAGRGTAPGGDGGAGGAASGQGNPGAPYGGGAGGNGTNGSGGAAGGNGLVQIRVFPQGWTLDRWMASYEIGTEA